MRCRLQHRVGRRTCLRNIARPQRLVKAVSLLTMPAQGDQWIAFDTPRTLVAKLQAAKAEYSLGGSMVGARWCRPHLLVRSVLPAGRASQIFTLVQSSELVGT